MEARINIAPLSIIVAVDKSGGFGYKGKIPWNFQEDMKHFQEVTKGGVCIMGKKTYTDMLAMRKKRKKKSKTPINEILPNRQSFVVSSTLKTAPGATIVNNITEAVQSLESNDTREVFVIGGYRMYVQALAWTTKIYMTIIDDYYKCDRFFPLNTLNNFNITGGEKLEKMSFVEYTRIK